MKILTGKTIQEADRYTIEHEPISSLDLMERASETLAQWIANHIAQESVLLLVVGKGNNGGDGLAVARMLHGAGFDCRVALIFEPEQLSEQCRQNLERLPAEIPVSQGLDFDIDPEVVIVDALLGTGVRGEVRGVAAEVIERINESGCRVVSIDIPSGMLTEYGNTADRIMVHASVTLTLEFPKLALLLLEAEEAVGQLEILPIGLSETFIEQVASPYVYVDEKLVRNIILSRPRFGHKGCFGHALLICGSEGMVGAAVLATGGALRSGCGLVTVHLPREERIAVQANYPAALVSCDPGAWFTQLPAQIDRYTAIGTGPGLGRHAESVEGLRAVLQCGKPLILDADALNLLAEHPDLLVQVPAGSILTPHLGELSRLIGDWTSDQQRNEKVQELARRLTSIVVVKGAHTMICAPEGTCYFNSTGNAGMAKGGSGDVLTGLITGLRSRGYNALEAAILGVYLHGVAGDKAADYYGQEGMNAGDLADFIGEGYRELEDHPFEN